MKALAESKLKLPYTLSIFGGVLYYLTLVLTLGLILVRNDHAIWMDLPLLGGTTLNENITNFGISYIFMTATGLALLYQKQALKSTLFVAGGLIVVNVVIETSVRILNTPDPMDAIAGIVGVLCGLLFLALLQKYFTQPRSRKK